MPELASPPLLDRDNLVDIVWSRGGVHGDADGPSVGRRLARDRDIAADTDECARLQRLGDPDRGPVSEKGLGR